MIRTNFIFNIIPRVPAVIVITFHFVSNCHVFNCNEQEKWYVFQTLKCCCVFSYECHRHLIHRFAPLLRKTCLYISFSTCNQTSHCCSSLIAVKIYLSSIIFENYFQPLVQLTFDFSIPAWPFIF